MAFEALIIDPNPTTRGYLWQATLAEVNFRKVKAYSKLDIALRHLQEGEKFDVLLITSQFPKEEIGSFISMSKISEGGKEAAYVIVLKAVDQDTENIANSMMDGFDGFLFEPFSVHSLRQVAAIAARVKSEFERARKRAAITLYAMDIMKAVDDLALTQFSGQDTTAKKRALAKSTHPLQKLTDADREIYVEVLTETFEKAVPRPPVTYRGASRRVQQKARELTAKNVTEQKKPKKR